MADKKIIIVAGPNGAGKTTFAQMYRSNEADCPVFIDVDEMADDQVADDMSPLPPAIASLRAGRLALQKINNYVREEKSFVFETTLAGRCYIRRIREWRTVGYSVELIFLSLMTPEEAIGRVRLRVQQGGHCVPESAICRRFHAGLRNFRNVYCHCVDDWWCYNNSGRDPVLVGGGYNER